MAKSRNKTSDLTPQLMPLWDLTLASAPISVTPAQVHSLALPQAGTYLVELLDQFVAGTLTAPRGVTWTLGVTNFVSMSMTALCMRAGVQQQVDPTRTTNNHQTAMSGFTTGNIARVQSSGVVVVSAPAVFTVQLEISAETGTLQVGSILRARRHG